MGVLTISSLTLEFVQVPVAARISGVWITPTSDTVQMAFTPLGAEPLSGDWKSATWDTDTSTDPDTYFAQCVVGPSGTVTLTDGTYAIWVKVTDSPEIPVRNVGTLVVN